MSSQSPTLRNVSEAVSEAVSVAESEVLPSPTYPREHVTGYPRPSKLSATGLNDGACLSVDISWWSRCDLEMLIGR